MVHCGIVHRAIGEGLHETLPFLHDKRKFSGGIDGAILDEHRELRTPGAWGACLHFQRILWRGGSILQGDTGHGGGNRRWMGRIGGMRNPGDIEERSPIIEESPCRIREIAVRPVSAKRTQELLPTRHQRGGVEWTPFSNPEHAAGRRRELFHIEAEIDFTRVNPWRLVTGHRLAPFRQVGRG